MFSRCAHPIRSAFLCIFCRSWEINEKWNEKQNIFFNPQLNANTGKTRIRIIEKGTAEERKRREIAFMVCEQHKTKHYLPFCCIVWLYFTFQCNPNECVLKIAPSTEGRWVISQLFSSQLLGIPNQRRSQRRRRRTAWNEQNAAH